MACRPLCVYCRQRPMEAPWAPFCSQRCKDVDLGRWLTGGYRIPDKSALSDDSDAPEGDVEDAATGPLKDHQG